MAFALKFISGKYQGGEFPLLPNREIVIGRSSELDMVLVEDMVSRKHAKIVTSDSNVVIQDLGSTNGTFVNGEKIKKARLKEGDRILVGTSILKLIEKSAGAPSDEAEARSQMEAAAKKGKNDSTMSGRIEDVPVPDLLQLFQTSKRSGVLVIKADQIGRVFLREGRVYYAVIGDNHDLGPQKAFNRIVAWEDGRFELSPPSDEEFMIELDEAPEALIMEGLRQLDELRRVRNDLPDVTAGVELESPIAPPLSDLEPDQLDVLQLVHNFGTHQEVLDQSEQSDVDASVILAHLLKKGYIRLE